MHIYICWNEWEYPTNNGIIDDISGIYNQNNDSKAIGSTIAKIDHKWMVETIKIWVIFYILGIGEAHR
jgi:hypothetical protein